MNNGDVTGTLESLYLLKLNPYFTFFQSLERDLQKSPRTQMKMRRISHGSTLSTSPGFGPVGLSNKFGSIENISFLPGKCCVYTTWFLIGK